MEMEILASLWSILTVEGFIYSSLALAVYKRLGVSRSLSVKWKQGRQSVRSTTTKFWPPHDLPCGNAVPVIYATIQQQRHR